MRSATSAVVLSAKKGVREEKEILKSGGLVRARDRLRPEGVIELAKANQAQHAVTRMCQLLDFSQSGLYAYVNRPASKRTVSSSKLLERIKHQHAVEGVSHDAAFMIFLMTEPS